MSVCLRAASASCTARLGFHFLPLIGFGTKLLTTVSLLPDSNNSVLTFTHLNSSVRLVTGNCRIPFPYNATLLIHRGTPSHFLIYELTNLSSLSTFDIGTSYTDNGHINLGNKPNCKHHNFNLPGSPDFSILPIPSTTSFLSCSICSLSFSSSLYHLPKLFTGLSLIDGISSSSTWNVLSIIFPLVSEMLLDLLGLIFILAHLRFSFNFSSNLFVQGTVMVTNVISSI